MKQIKNKKKEFELSHLDKILFPESNITKQDVINYYEKIAPYFLKHARDYLLVMQRFPEGISKTGFFQKQISDYFPSWMHHKTIDLKKGEKQTLIVLEDKEELIYLANQAVLVFHSWLSRQDEVKRPTKIVFDLDPSDSDLNNLRFAAKALKAILEDHNLKSFLMTTGSKGYHVVAPIIPDHNFPKVHDFTKHIANKLAEKYPDRFTVDINKLKRKNRIFIDYLRNSFGQTSVACYSLRAREGAPIATPLDWSELSKTEPQKYNIHNIFKRLEKKGDPWQNFENSAKKLLLDDLDFDI